MRSCSDGDRQGHEEQGGPDREAEQQCYYSVSFPRQLPPSPTHVRRSLPSPPSPLFIYSGFVVVSQPQVTVNR